MAAAPERRGRQAGGDSFRRTHAHRAARSLFEKAFEQSKEAYERFPRASVDDEKIRADRLRAESDFLRAQINLAICMYEEALTYEPKSDERHKTLSEGAAAFEKIHIKYRSQGAGLRAQLWEGKCFEEQGDTQKALGIYNELLQNHGDNETVRQIRDQAVQFRLACLNQRTGQDKSLVVNEATQWLELRQGPPTRFDGPGHSLAKGPRGRKTRRRQECRSGRSRAGSRWQPPTPAR